MVTAWSEQAGGLCLLCRKLGCIVCFLQASGELASVSRMSVLHSCLLPIPKQNNLKLCGCESWTLWGWAYSSYSMLWQGIMASEAACILNHFDLGILQLLLFPLQALLEILKALGTNYSCKQTAQKPSLLRCIHSSCELTKSSALLFDAQVFCSCGLTPQTIKYGSRKILRIIVLPWCSRKNTSHLLESPFLSAIALSWLLLSQGSRTATERWLSVPSFFGHRIIY